MKRILTFLSCLLLTGCTAIDLRPDDRYASCGDGDVLMDVEDIIFDDDTRTEALLDEVKGLSFRWSDGDKVGVYTDEGGLALFNLASGEGSSEAVFNGQGFALKEGKTYYAAFPYNGSATDMNSVSLDYSARKISGDNVLQDIVKYDFLASTAVADEGSHAAFSFRHLSSFGRFTITLPCSETVTSLDFIPTYNPMVDKAAYDLQKGASTTVSDKVVSNFPTENITSDKFTFWLPMAPQTLSDAAVIVNTSSGNRYSTRVSGKDLKAGRAYRWTLEAPLYPTEPEGFSVSALYTNSISSLPSGQYSGITKVSDGRYAVVHDKYNGGGIIFFNLTFNDSGHLSSSSYDIPDGTTESSTGRDPEGIVYVPSSNTLFVAGEGDQQILEYDMDGRPTGRGLAVPADMSGGFISSNYGFESLGYSAATGLFWTTTESALSKDRAYSFSGGLMIRLQSFSDKTLEPGKRYLYMTDASQHTVESGDNYAFGVPDILALDDGRLIILEREAWSNTSSSAMLGSSAIMKLYLVDPVNDKGGVLSKKLLYSKTTYAVNILSGGWLNYEGLCLGPSLSGKDGTILLVNDSQDRYKGILQDCLTVLSF